ncbi:MAG: hypothetical protein KAT58_10470 [candidate division Zixibacteria bacterium]|nr:hypothetical protein [candidate division Zixibacteria bacterium]
MAIAESDLIPALETTVLTGTITAITPEKLEVEVLQVISNPLEQPAPTKRVVSLGADTKLFWATLFTEQESVAAEESYNKAHEAWQKQIDAGLEMDPPEPPGENKLEKIELSRLITGMTVKIIASENIATATSFEAIRIEASESMTPEEETEPELEGTVIEDNANYDATIVDSDEALPLDSEPEGINPNTDDQPTTPAVEPGGGTAPELDAEE